MQSGQIGRPQVEQRHARLARRVAVAGLRAVGGGAQLDRRYSRSDDRRLGSSAGGRQAGAAMTGALRGRGAAAVGLGRHEDLVDALEPAGTSTVGAAVGVGRGRARRSGSGASARALEPHLVDAAARRRGAVGARCSVGRRRRRAERRARAVGADGERRPGPVAGARPDAADREQHDAADRRRARGATPAARAAGTGRGASAGQAPPASGARRAAGAPARGAVGLRARRRRAARPPRARRP